MRQFACKSSIIFTMHVVVTFYFIAYCDHHGNCSHQACVVSSVRCTQKCGNIVWTVKWTKMQMMSKLIHCSGKCGQWIGNVQYSTRWTMWNTPNPLKNQPICCMSKTDLLYELPHIRWKWRKLFRFLLKISAIWTKLSAIARMKPSNSAKIHQHTTLMITLRPNNNWRYWPLAAVKYAAQMNY